jgi:hypothetical protein
MLDAVQELQGMGKWMYLGLTLKEAIRKSQPSIGKHI